MNKIAGMAHIVLPGKEAASDRRNPYKFAREGTIMLIQEMISNGADKKKITAKIVGGAKMFETQGKEWEIGKQNVKAVKETLLGEGVKVLAEETGRNYGRTVFFYAETGKVQVNTVKRQTIVI